MKMKAAVLEEIGRPGPYAETRPISVCEVDLDGPRDGEILVEIAAAGLCHSDLSVVNGDRPRQLPLVMGHESAGIVRAVGPDVERFEPGDHVISVFVPSCGHCGPCRSGRPALCEPGAAANNTGMLIGGGSRLSRNGETLYHMTGVSCFAEYAVISQNSLVKIDSSIPLDIAALMGCAVLTGAGAVFNTGDVCPGCSTAVVGLGGVGLSAVMAAYAAGAEKIVAVDIIPDKLELAKELGATHTIDSSKEGALEELRELTSGGGRHGDGFHRERQRLALCLRRHAPRRRDGHRRLAEPESHAADPGRRPDRGRAHPQRVLPWIRRPEPDIHASLPSMPRAACRWNG